MAEKRIKIPSDGLIIIPKEVIPRIQSANESDIKTLLCYFADPEISVADCARISGLTVEKVNNSVSFWRGAGIFTEGEAKKTVAHDTSSYRNYDSATLSEAMDTDNSFKMVYEIATEELGKQLTKNDISALYYLYDFVRIPAPVICGIIGYCCKNGKKGMQYIYKKAVGLYEEEGIDSVEKLDSYIARREMIETDIGRMRKIFGMGERSLSAKESETFNRWFGEWNMNFETVNLAYDAMIDNIGKINIKYMDAILKRWFESGYETPEDVKKGESSRTEGTSASFDTDEFIQAALNRKFDD